MAVTQYIGARYVPITANPIEWSNANAYEPLTIVTYQGNSYTSRQYVPVGIDITNDNYWALTGNYNAQVEQYRQEVLTFDNRIAANTTAIEGEISARENADTAISALVTENTTAIENEISARENADATISALVSANTTAIESEISARENADTLISSYLVKNVKKYGAVGDGVTNDSSAIAAAIAGGGVVYFPVGTYLIKTGITLVSNLKMIGYGAKIYIDHDDAPATFEMAGLGFSTDSSANTLHDCIIEGFEITGNASFKSVGITLRQNHSISSTVINRVFIRNCHIHDLGFRGINAIGAASGDSPFGHGTPDITVEGCLIHDCAGHTICNSGTSMKVFNCRVYNSGSECISVDNGCYKFWIDNCYFENARSGAGCISIDESNTVFIANSLFNQPNHDRPAVRFNNSSGNVNHAMMINCYMLGGTYALSMGGTNYFTQLVISNCEASGSTTGSVLSRHAEDLIVSSGNNWFRNMTAEQKAALASKIRNSSSGNTII